MLIRIQTLILLYFVSLSCSLVAFLVNRLCGQNIGVQYSTLIESRIYTRQNTSNQFTDEQMMGARASTNKIQEHVIVNI